MSEHMSIGFVCNNCGNDNVFSIRYIRDGDGIDVTCEDCDTTQVIGNRL